MPPAVAADAPVKEMSASFPRGRKVGPIILAAGALAVAAFTAMLLVALRGITIPSKGVPPRVQPPPSANRVIASPIVPPAVRPDPAPDPIAEKELLNSSTRVPEASVILTVEELVSRSMPAVVTVETSDGIGSGFFVSREVLLTNAHVVRGNSAVMLRSGGTRPKTARVKSQSDSIDLAVLTVDIVDLNQVYLPLAVPADVHVGAEVIAIGSPLGLQNTVTRGIVSALRDVQGVSLVQTDAAINAGNSGGPLLDRYGRVVGINTWKIAGGSAQSLGFAVSTYYARAMLGPEFAPKGDRSYETGLREYTENLRVLADRADAVDANWKRFRTECQAEEAGRSVDREWFALWDGHRPQMRESASCRSWYDYFKDSASTLHDALKRYQATGREAGLPADRMRVVRRRYNLIWPAWES